MRKAALAVLLVIAGCYDTAFRDCTIACATATGCPNGLSCGIDGYCRIDGARGTCAEVTGDAPNDAVAGDRPDGPSDGPMIDAAQAATLQQTADTTIAPNNSVSCQNATETRENTWYRVFALAEHGIVGRPFHVQKVTFAIQLASGGTQVQVRLGTYAGVLGASTLDLAQVTSLGSTQVAVPATTTGLVLEAPIAATVPANGQLAVEIFSPSLQGLGKRVFLGATTSTQTRPGYQRAPDCSVTVPTDVATLGYPSSHLIITVTGQY